MESIKSVCDTINKRYDNDRQWVKAHADNIREFKAANQDGHCQYFDDSLRQQFDIDEAKEQAIVDLLKPMDATVQATLANEFILRCHGIGGNRGYDYALEVLQERVNYLA